LSPQAFRPTYTNAGVCLPPATHEHIQPVSRHRNFTRTKKMNFFQLRAGLSQPRQRFIIQKAFVLRGLPHAGSPNYLKPFLLPSPRSYHSPLEPLPGFLSVFKSSWFLPFFSPGDSSPNVFPLHPARRNSRVDFFIGTLSREADVRPSIVKHFFRMWAPCPHAHPVSRIFVLQY